ncbi:ClpXP protease specificity-enhancing factor [Uruburuella testudinis]|uniref:ClpXP protease specificity-enhancing factor n=1 Tax=Uruburuella testudinis TaxID=1282863 RepID=A0ABY4DSV6_9NEIS|nr:ClpXP protease specificity-enhancing factor [Uruburuella testudinis]UOO81667.1 ClpXP protease specificity-enhancing factor [Uruburuella testudinis]
MSASTKPYILRGLYEWCLDNDQTPHIVAWVNEHTRVPMQYVRDNEIVLNIAPSASHNLIIDNEWISFSARFSGVSHEIWIPVGHVISLFARESGEGMGFEVEAYQTESEKKGEAPLHLLDTPPEPQPEQPLAEPGGQGKKKEVAEDKPKPKKGLKLIK